MRQEMAELRKEMREVMACIGQLMEKRSVRKHDAHCPGRTALCFDDSGQMIAPRQAIDGGCVSPFADSFYPAPPHFGRGGREGGRGDYSLRLYTVLTNVAFPHGAVADLAKTHRFLVAAKVRTRICSVSRSEAQ